MLEGLCLKACVVAGPCAQAFITMSCVQAGASSLRCPQSGGRVENDLQIIKHFLNEPCGQAPICVMHC